MIKRKKLKVGETFINKVICTYQIIYNVSTGQFTMDFTNLHCGRMIITKPVKVEISHQHDLFKTSKTDCKKYEKFIEKV